MKQYHRYQMDFNCKAIWFSGICMGLSIFLLSVYYLFIQEIGLVPAGKQILYLWTPILLSFVYLILMRVLRWNSAGAFAILGAAVCLLLMIQLFPTGNVLRIILGILGYIIGGGLLVLCAMGVLPGRMIVSLVFLVILVLRLLLFRTANGWGLLPEIAQLSTIAGLMFLPVAYKDTAAA